MKDLSTLVTPLNEDVKKSVRLKWEVEQELTLILLKEKLCFALILALPEFTKAFEIECNAFGIGIGVV